VPYGIIFQPRDTRSELILITIKRKCTMHQATVVYATAFLHHSVLAQKKWRNIKASSTEHYTRTGGIPVFDQQQK